MQLEKVVGVGNFGIEHVKIGANKDSFPGGAGFRFALLTSLYLPRVKIFSLVGKEPLWNRALDALAKIGTNIDGITRVDNGINFFTYYDEERRLLKYRIMNSEVMTEITKQNVKPDLDSTTLFHICPFDYESQARLVNIGVISNSYISLQMHHSSITDTTQGKYLELFKNINLLFMTEDEAIKLTQLPSAEAGNLISNNTKGYTLITKGERGVTVYQSGQNLFDAKPEPIINPRNLEGAGDAFAAGTIVGFIKTNNIKEAVLNGFTTARLSIQSKSTQDMIKYIQDGNYKSQS